VAIDNSAHDPLADSLRPVSPTKPALDWKVRNRATSSEVQRYSRFVVIMKRALPMAAAALLAAVIAYSLQPRLQGGKKLALTFQRLRIVNNDLEMIKPRLTGVDGQGNPYVVTAEKAIQDLHNAKHARLQSVEADMTLKDGKWLNLTATQGWLDTLKQKLWLRGAIDVFSDNGYEAHTTAADIDMLTGAVVGSHTVSGQGPLGTFRADNFRIDRGTVHEKKRGAAHNPKLEARNQKTKLFLYGNVRMTIYKHGTHK
jgi:lipopolysaccharide export system protein LptC